MVDRPLAEDSVVAQILFVFELEAISRRRSVFTPVAYFGLLHFHSSFWSSSVEGAGERDPTIQKELASERAFIMPNDNACLTSEAR